jgi:hypothetical protein
MSFTALVLSISSVASATDDRAAQFAWTSENLNTAVAMACSEKYSRVINQNDPAEFLVSNWSWSQQGNITTIMGDCGQRVNSKFEIIPESSTHLEFVFDYEQFKSSDDIVIEGRIGSHGFKFYFKSRTALDDSHNLVSIKTLTKIGMSGFAKDSTWRAMVPIADSLSEQLHGAATLVGAWADNQNILYTQVTGENDRFGNTIGVLAGRDTYGMHRILYRTSNLIRNEHIMSSLDDAAQAVYMSNGYSSHQYRGCSYFAESNKRITPQQCAAILTKIKL